MRRTEMLVSCRDDETTFGAGPRYFTTEQHSLRKKGLGEMVFKAIITRCVQTFEYIWWGWRGAR